MITCNWDHPGADAYTGTPRAAIMAMAEIPRPVRLALADRAEHHDFDDAVLIDNTSIHGRYVYTQLRSMAFGSRGRVCDQVSWHWPANQVEGGWIYCESGYCILMPAACRNWSIVTRQERSPSLAIGFVDETEFLTPAGPVGSGPGFVTAPLIAGPASSITTGSAYPTFAGPSWFGDASVVIDARVGRLSAACDCELPTPCVIAAVPEPSTWSLLLVEIIGTLIAFRRWAK